MKDLYYPPKIKLEVLEQETIPDKGFFKVLRSKVKAYYPSGKISEPFTVDSVLRDRMDAVVILGHFQGFEFGFSNQRHVYLRSALRPAFMFRDYSASKTLEDQYVGNLYELPAGLVEQDELGTIGLQKAAVREFQEEVGFNVSSDKMKFLGRRIFPTVGVMAERIFFLETEVVPTSRTEPTLDGSPLEEDGIVIPVPLKEAIEMCAKGYLPDAKTEIGLRRLADKYGY